MWTHARWKQLNFVARIHVVVEEFLVSALPACGWATKNLRWFEGWEVVVQNLLNAVAAMFGLPPRQVFDTFLPKEPA